jgi:hypothetical protein
MEGASALSQGRRLGIRQQMSPWPQAVLGAGDPAEVHPASGAWNRKEFRMACVSTHILDSIEKRWHRIQSDARTASALLTAVNSRRLYPSHYAGQARRPSRRRVARVFHTRPNGGAHLKCRKPGNRKLRLTKLGCKRGTFWCPFCTPIKLRLFQVSLLECMAGTTGLEPATSAVTEVLLIVTH